MSDSGSDLESSSDETSINAASLTNDTRTDSTGSQMDTESLSEAQPSDARFDSDSQMDVDSPIPITKPTFGSKHARTEDDSSNRDSESSDTESIQHTTKYRKPGEGTSKSAVHARKRRAKLAQGELEFDERRYRQWQEKVLEGDSAAEFDEKNIRRARHSSCGTFVTMKDVFDISRWKAHLKNCKALKRGEKMRTQSLFKLGWTKTAKPLPDEVDNSELEGRSIPAHTKLFPKVPCPGITSVDNPKVLQYLQRTGAMGGGARSLPIIARELFNKMFSKLKNKEERQRVLDIQMHEWSWRNDHVNLRVYSTACERMVAEPVPSNPKERTLSCLSCRSILKNKAFKNVLAKPIPNDKNYIFINERFRNTALAKIFSRVIGVREIFEAKVCSFPEI